MKRRGFLFGLVAAPAAAVLPAPRLAYASGGVLNRSLPYAIGERGPEMVIPRDRHVVDLVRLSERGPTLFVLDLDDDEASRLGRVFSEFSGSEDRAPEASLLKMPT